MTESPDEYGEVLRRVLRAEADSVVPSAEGLQIIRTRIEQRGVRGIFWWRAAASAFGAVLVAAAVVMFVPGLKVQIGTGQHIIQVQYDTSPPDESSTQRPPNGVHASSAVVGSPTSRPAASPSGTAPAVPSPSVTASPGNDCATAAPTAVEPDASDSPQPCAEPTATESQPDRTTEPRPTPSHQSTTPTPTRTASATPKPSPRPTVEQPTPTASQAPSDPPAPTATPLMTTEADSSTNSSQE
ncbi:hypothetical protein ABZT47_01900 [Sphaerisporangium sp. NPDC005289]|uniref:hypothetical protein n=1 Tax=Sphaerisporangium sp. NPDC005289 TaxID=3155247 RepID=UPI0033B35BBC